MSHKILHAFRSLSLQIAAFALTFGYLLWCLSIGSVTAVQNGKVFKQRDVNAKDPVKIVSLAAANKPLKLDESFDGGDDWLRGTQLRLRNVANKEIIYLELQFNFPETKSSGNEMSYRAELGNMPGARITNAPLVFKPGEEISFSFRDEEYQNLVKFVGTRTKIANLNKADLKIGFVVFADSTAWGTGLWFKPNPNRKGSWIPDANQSQR
jgi:hypothetical protein